MSPPPLLSTKVTYTQCKKYCNRQIKNEGNIHNVSTIVDLQKEYIKTDTLTADVDLRLEFESIEIISSYSNTICNDDESESFTDPDFLSKKERKVSNRSRTVRSKVASPSRSLKKSSPKRRRSRHLR